MKIKELHLRNIASIEEADIDFEKGLNDGVTGTPASVFLISGDTGAGKSVILDGISMALYKSTPRIAGVTNANKNEFTDAGGESIRVGSIEQYTRLGISDKDECYSEVAFTGNDGVEYRAKLTLGMLLGNTDKATGLRPMKHRAPKWEIKIGGGDWTKDNVEQTILSAVGLSFAQFGRMAMLAQGQFAAFLTGDKKERESILEQLTNTEHFTAYGKAIKSLFDKAKTNRETAQVAYDTESQHTLPTDKVDALTEEKKILEGERDKLGKKDAANEETIRLVTAVETNRKTADSETTERTRLEAVTKGEEYMDAKALVTDWDSTSTERQRLSVLRKAMADITAAKDRIEAQKKTFLTLSADLEARREALKAQGDPKKAVDDKQAEIDEMTEQRNALKPGAVNTELKSLSSRKPDLAAIATREEKLAADTLICKTLEEEIKADEKALEADKVKFDDAKKAYDDAKAKADAAERRFSTMSTGVQDAMIGIRKRLVDENAEICPLCGQHISEIHLDEEFKSLLTPFEKEQKDTAEALRKAEGDRDAAKSAYDRASGAIETKKGDLENKVKAVGDERKELGEEAEKLGIDIEKPIAEQISSALEAIRIREAQLHEIQKQAEDLQTKIAEAQKAKKPLDDALTKFNKDVQIVRSIETTRSAVIEKHHDWDFDVEPKEYECKDITTEWNNLLKDLSGDAALVKSLDTTISECNEVLEAYYNSSGKSEADLVRISERASELGKAREFVKETDENLKSKSDAVKSALDNIKTALEALNVTEEMDIPQMQALLDLKKSYKEQNDELVGKINVIATQLEENDANIGRRDAAKGELDKAEALYKKWNILNTYFGGTRFRTLVQTYILRPLLNNANIYLEKITDRYALTCSEDNEQLSILVLDRYNKDQIRSVTVLSGGERFMISLALSLALSSLNRPDMNVNILFIDEGFGTLDEKSLDSVMETLEKLQEIAGQTERRVGIISHREELDERIPVKIQVEKKGEGRSKVKIKNTL